ncbi:MAG TPA: NUDIX hydrolase [Bacteroidota bacterium]|nr:NUDIX hydrolase [Bacteroidota bacterium]
MAGPKVLRSEKKYSGKVFDLIVDEIEYPSGNRSVREVAAHPGGAVIAPLLPDNEIILVRQFRYPIQGYVYELPAGKLNPDEDPLVCAHRELGEETGYTAGRMQLLTAIYTTPGFCNERLHIYLATDLKPSGRGQQLEEGEASLTLEVVPLRRALEMIERQEIVDGKTICGILLADRLLNRTKGA